MKIRINEIPISFELEHEKNAGEVFDGLAEWLRSAGHKLERVSLNAEAIDEQSDTWRNIRVADIETLDIEAKSLRERQVEDFETIIHFTELLRRVLTDGDEEQLRSVLDELPHVSAGIDRNAPDLSGLLEEPLRESDLSDESVRNRAAQRATEFIQLLEARQRELLDPDHEMRSTLGLLDGILPSFEEIPGEIQSGNRGRAMETIARFSELVAKELRILPLLLEIHPEMKDERVEEESIVNTLPQLNEFFSELEGAIVNQDFVLVGDLLEYEMLPRFNALHAAVRKHVANPD